MARRLARLRRLTQSPRLPRNEQKKTTGLGQWFFIIVARLSGQRLAGALALAVLFYLREAQKSITNTRAKPTRAKITARVTSLVQASGKTLFN